MHFIRTFILVASLTLVLPEATLAQSGEDGPAEDTATDIKVLPPAYDEQMMRLSEILGALHYLRELCGADEGQLWREQMQNMIEQEEPTAERRAMMIARFNRGFRGFQETYRECTNAALEANNRYVFEGAKLAGEIPGRYGR
ncbi:MAG: TIGR02301 family protein [Pseudomonadota bacterium]